MLGVGLLLFLAVLGGCQEPQSEASLQRLEEARALGFSSGAELHQVTLGGRGSEEHAVPSIIQAFPGDGVEFRTVDHRVHTVTFLADSLAPPLRDFLEATGQMGSPPLVSRGSRFIVRLEDAPQGRYPFETKGHGGTANGVVVVGLRPPADSTGVGEG
jgi:plastocyanin